jgi:flavodoxin short chain
MKKVAVIYWSGTGNTEKMAEGVAKGLAGKGCEAELLRVDQVGAGSEAEYQAFALGCPAMGNEVVEEMEMEPFLQRLENRKLSAIPVVLFGSYDWGSGQWMQEWEERMNGMGAQVVTTGLTIQGTPDQAGEQQCVELGEKLAAAIG